MLWDIESSSILEREEKTQSSHTIKWHEIHLCVYVLARNILSPRSCFLCSYVCIGLPGPAHPTKVKYSLRSDQLHWLFPCSYEQREYLIFAPYKTLGTQTPVKRLNLFDYLWRVLVIQLHSHTLSLPTSFWKGRSDTVFLTIKRHEIHLFLSLFAHIYVCIGQKYSVSKVLFSLLVCM